MFITTIEANPIRFRLINTILYGSPYKPQCFDSDQDGYTNIIFTYGTMQIPVHVQFWEYRPYDRFILDDTMAFIGVVTDVEFFDSDNLVDMLVRFHMNESLAIYEQTNISQHPKYRVWEYQNQNIGEAIVADLDQDGYNDILHSGSFNYVYILENTFDNEYQVVSIDTVINNSTWCFTVGNFDNDSRLDFATSGGNAYINIFECVGNNDYHLIFHDTLPMSIPEDVFYSPDLDGNGKPELFFGTFTYLTGSVHLWRYEMIADNLYDFTLTDSVNIEAIDGYSTRSACGDIDADGVNEIVWTSYDNWRVLKATGIGTFERVFELYPTGDWWARSTLVNICDLNRNGYPEVVEAVYRTTNPAQYLTRIWEIEGVRLHYPNGAEVLNPSDTCLIRWEKFYPPGADSFSLFFSADSGRTYDTIVLGISGSDTSYLWTVPDTVSDSCLIMIWAYGPPRPGEQTPRGTAWDFSDSVFCIRPMGIKDEKSTDLLKFRCDVYPNPFKDNTTIEYDLPRVMNVHLALYDASGRLVKLLANGTMNAGVYHSTVKQNDLPQGIYFLRFTTEEKYTTKIVKLK